MILRQLGSGSTGAVSLQRSAFLTGCQSISDLSRSARTPAANRTLAESVHPLIEEAIESDNYEAAGHLATDGLGYAQKAQDNSLLLRLKSLKERVQTLQREYARLEVALKTLREKPGDPTANLAVGRFLCFQKESWEKGLPLLAKGQDAALKSAAEADLSAPKAALQAIKLADQWSNLAEKESGTVKKPIERRALKWYRSALPNSTGLDRADIEKKIAALLFPAARIWETRSGENGAVLGGESFNVSSEFTIEFWFATAAESCVLLTKRHKGPEGSLTLLLRGGCPVVIGDAAFYRVDGVSHTRANDGDWHHLAAVNSNGQVQLYLDGNQVAEIKTRPGFISKSPWVLGHHGAWDLATVDAKFARIRRSRVARYAGPFSPPDYASDKESLLFK
ncbi:MAG: LamG domain-containing protein [Planctomycetes bacterium]|nr:LamG domain-containing protein [Planctomycetota bacterium]